MVVKIHSDKSENEMKTRESLKSNSNLSELHRFFVSQTFVVKCYMFPPESNITLQ